MHSDRHEVEFPLRWSLAALLLLVGGCDKDPEAAPAPEAVVSPTPVAPAEHHAPADHHAPAEHHADSHAEHHADHHGQGPNAAHDGRGHAHHHRFEDAESWAKQFDDPARDQWQRPDAVLDFIGLAADARVADLGAGTGYFSVRLAGRVPQGRVLANDIEPDMVRYLGERATKEGLRNVVPVQGKADDPALPEAVDVIFMCDVVHHIEDRPAYFRKAVAQLRPGGRVVIVDFKKDAPDDAPGPPAAMRLAQDALVAELGQAGLVLARADATTLPYQYIVELTVAEP